MPPKADVGIAGQRLAVSVVAEGRAFGHAHGLACLTMTQAAVRAGSNSATHSYAASVSLMLL